MKRKQIEVPAEVAVDQPEGWKESKKRKGEGGRPVTKDVAGFANLSAYKEKYGSLLKANGWGVGGRVMPKNSWSSWQEAVKSLLEILGKQRVHQMTGGSNVGGVGGTDGADRQEEGDAEEEEAEEEEEEEEEGEGGGVGDVEEEEGEEEVDLLTTMSEEEASNVFQNFFDV